MRFLKYTGITLVALVLIGSAGYLLAASGLQSKPGYAKLTLPSWASTDTIVALNLGPRGLKPVRWVVKRVLDDADHDLELNELLALSVLNDLQGVQMRVYEVDNNRPVFEQAIDDSIVSLKQADWQILLRVREDDKRIVILQSENQGVIAGLSLLASSPDNAVFMNLVGPINPESIAKIAQNWN